MQQYAILFKDRLSGNWFRTTLAELYNDLKEALLKCNQLSAGNNRPYKVVRYVPPVVGEKKLVDEYYGWDDAMNRYCQTNLEREVYMRIYNRMPQQRKLKLITINTTDEQFLDLE